MKKYFTLFFILSFIALIGVTCPSDEIKTECGGRARIVWCQDAGDGSDAGAEGDHLRLMGFDTEGGRGERIILSKLSNYAKPLLTPDGNKIIFSNKPEQKIYVVGFDGSDLKPLTNGFALAVWRDSLTETDWVYAGTVVNQADSIIINIRRFRLDKPEVNEPVWSKTPLNIDNFQLSASGRYAGGIFPWPSCGVAMLPDGEWTKYGDGCWPSLSPDSNLLFWIFDGAHRNLTLFRTKTGERWVVNINNAPGMDGFEVYHPRWSNSALFMVMTGPYKMGTGDNRIRGGGRNVEIYLGKFSKDFKKIERWIQVTHNQSADFFPDLWLAEPMARTKERQTEQSLTGPVGNGLQEKKKASADAWPGSFDGLVFYWQNRSKANTFTDPVAHFSCVCRAEAKGRARYGRHFEMAPSGGAFIADGGAGELVEKCSASRQLGIEALITPMESVAKISSEPTPSVTADIPSAGGDLKNLKDMRLCSPPCPGFAEARALRPGESGGWVRERQKKNFLLPIIGYAAKTGNWNFLLGQKENQLIFQLRSEKTEKNYILILGALASNVPNHIIVSCSSSSIACYLNGKQISCHDSIFGGNWEPGKIVFGNELRGEYAVDPGDSEALRGRDYAGRVLGRARAGFARLGGAFGEAWAEPCEAKMAKKGKSGWKGLIENVALYSRWIGPEEARKKYSASVAAITERKALPVLAVKAKLISMPIVPAPESIVPYRRALAVGQYRIEQVTEGTCSNREVMVAQWAILDGRMINLMSRNCKEAGPDCQSGRKDGGTELSRPTSCFCNRQEGEMISMRLELFSDHPELEGERLIMDSDRFDLPLYYEVGD